MNFQKDKSIRSAEMFVSDYCLKTIGKPVKLELTSRLCEKNLVYKVVISNDSIYSVKLFLNKQNPSQRLKLEQEIINIQKEYCFHTFRAKDISHYQIIDDHVFYAITVRPWIMGVSFKDVLKENFPKFNVLCLPTIKQIGNELWNSQVSSDVIPVLSSVFMRNRFDIDFLYTIYPVDLVKNLEFVHNSLIPESQVFRLINGDISLHEFLIEDSGDMYIIDWEELSLGDPVIDIAGVFYSIFEHLVKIMTLEEILEYAKKYLVFFNINCNRDFAYHFLERVVMADYLTQNQNTKLIDSALLLINTLINVY